MDDVQITFIVGACLFGVGAIITGFIFAVFVYKNYQKAEQLVAAGKIYSTRDVHWLNSIYIYFILFTCFVLFTGLYSTEATYAGLYPQGPNRIIAWLRWPMLAITGAIYIAGLAFLLTEDGDVTWNRHPRPSLRAQSFFIVFYYFLAYLAIYFATIVVPNNGKIVLMVFSIVLFLISGVLFLVPYNKCALPNPEHPHDYVLFTGNDNGGGGSRSSRTMSLEEKKRVHVDAEERNSVIMGYRWVFVIFVAFSYFFNVIIWFCSRSNNIWTDGLSFRDECILYLISDAVFIVLFGIVLMFLTFWYGMKTVSITDKQGNITYAARPSLAATTALGANSGVRSRAKASIVNTDTSSSVRQRVAK